LGQKILSKLCKNFPSLIVSDNASNPSSHLSQNENQNNRKNNKGNNNKQNANNRYNKNNQKQGPNQHQSNMNYKSLPNRGGKPNYQNANHRDNKDNSKDSHNKNQRKSFQKKNNNPMGPYPQPGFGYPMQNEMNYPYPMQGEMLSSVNGMGPHVYQSGVYMPPNPMYNQYYNPMYYQGFPNQPGNQNAGGFYGNFYWFCEKEKNVF